MTENPNEKQQPDAQQKIKESHLKCGHCGNRFRSPIFFGNVRTFETATTAGNTAQCPKCGKMISCNKDNMSYVLEDESGGLVGDNFSR
jgi:uncharacterized C2H2 Zn-finger protein